jgi:hypothetical protein
VRGFKIRYFSPDFVSNKNEIAENWDFERNTLGFEFELDDEIEIKLYLYKNIDGI